LSNPTIFPFAIRRIQGFQHYARIGARFQNLTPKSGNTPDSLLKEFWPVHFGAILPWNFIIAIPKASAIMPKTLGKVLSR